MKSLGFYLMMGLLFLLTGSYAQDKADIAEQVNQQLWKPFKAAFEARNWAAFNALHTADVVRVSSWGIKVGDDYRESVKTAYSQPDDRKKTIDFWLEHRIYNEEIGYEVGYYKITSQAPGEALKTYYARFHVVLKKEEGQWKIAQDWDTNTVNGNAVNEEDFAKGTPLKL